MNTDTDDWMETTRTAYIIVDPELLLADLEALVPAAPEVRQILRDHVKIVSARTIHPANAADYEEHRSRRALAEEIFGHVKVTKESRRVPADYAYFYRDQDA